MLKRHCCVFLERGEKEVEVRRIIVGVVGVVVGPCIYVSVFTFFVFFLFNSTYANMTVFVISGDTHEPL